MIQSKSMGYALRMQLECDIKSDNYSGNREFSIPGVKTVIKILEALSDKNADIHYHAVCAAGNWAVDAAWPHICAIVDADTTDKPLLLAAIDAVVNIRPQEAAAVIGDFLDDDDQEVVDAVYEALAMAEALNEIDDENEDDDFLK